tara:strand:- start:39812 stop:40579 length:768 start_codon:yes stop_codon:yes gene_type:complete
MSDLDQFFTNSNIVDMCIATINLDEYDIIIEPSAGAGAFYNKLPNNKIGIDLCPRIDGLIKKDYLTFTPLTDDNKLLVIGNPPFGKNSSLAVKFFNHSAKFANTIAFILPRTFRKFSIINRLCENYHLELETILPIDSFHLPDGTEYGVPCVWQVWKLGPIRQKMYIRTVHPDFQFVKDKSDADFLIQRVGANAGLTHKNFNKSSSSHYLIKGGDLVYQIMKKIDWTKNNSPKYDTAGNPSITKNELIEEYIKNA